jgi:hypothetical protein
MNLPPSECFITDEDFSKCRLISQPPLRLVVTDLGECLMINAKGLLKRTIPSATRLAETNTS